MNKTLYFLVIGVGIIMTIKNTLKMKEYKHERNFVDTYTKILNGDADAYEALKNYIAAENRADLLAKAKLLVIYEKMIMGEDVLQDAKELDLSILFKNKNGNYNTKLATRNADAFIWLVMVFAKGRAIQAFDAMDVIYDHVVSFEEGLEYCLEYKMFKGVVAVLAENKDENAAFLNSLVVGEYDGLLYEKRLIGLYKRIAASLVAYKKEELDDFYKEDLRNFASKLVGKVLLTDLGLIETYPPIVVEAPVKEEPKTLLTMLINKKKKKEEASKETKEAEVIDVEATPVEENKEEDK